jgi:hypothetical protein
MTGAEWAGIGSPILVSGHQRFIQNLYFCVDVRLCFQPYNVVGDLVFMFRNGTRVPGASAPLWLSAIKGLFDHTGQRGTPQGHQDSSYVVSEFVLSKFHLPTRVAMGIVAVSLLATPGRLLAQHGGGGRGMMGGGGTGVGGGFPSGVDEKDDLKDFHRAIALQATDEQRAAFGKIAQYTQAACDQLHAFRESVVKAPGGSSSLVAERAGALDGAIAKARTSSENFLTSFSPAQKSGLKDLTNKLAKTDGELEKQTKALDPVVQGKADKEQVAGAAGPDVVTLGVSSLDVASLDKELGSFQSEQLAIGREMGILLASDSELTFKLPKATNTIEVGGESISVPTSEAASRAAAENGKDIFTLKLVADLSEVQVNVTGILRSAVNRAPRCGERIEVQQARFTPLAPASLVAATLHFERWVCQPGAGSMEVAGGDATFEVKLTPSVEGATTQQASSLQSSMQRGSIEKNTVEKTPGATTGRLHLTSEITRVEAEGFLRDLLRSGDLGISLRDQIAGVLLATMQKTADLKAGLPPVAQSAVLQKAEFQDAGADQLNLVLGGRLEFSDEQTKQFAAQLKQPFAAQSATGP